MPLYLVNPAVEMTLELYVSQHLEESLTIQYERIKDPTVRDTFVARLEQKVETLLKDSIDWDLKEPTEAQLKYALLVAKQRRIPLPSEARKYRFHTAMFLETYAPRVKNSVKQTDPRMSGLAAATAEQLVADRLREEAADGSV